MTLEVRNDKNSPISIIIPTYNVGVLTDALSNFILNKKLTFKEKLWQ